MLSPLESAEGILVTAAIRDITARKRLDKMKDEFVASVSHELRTPLTSIAGSLGLLMGGAGGVLPEPAARLIKVAHANSQRLVRLVSDILDIEKMESGSVVFNFARVELPSLVEQTIEANRGLAESHGVRIRFEGVQDGCDVRADADRLAQVVTNLLSNAIKFSPAESEVVVALERKAGTASISVRDHGPGIPDGFKQRVFERFAQADATNTGQKGGTGLGLSIVKQIVDRLDGKVGFAGAPGGGTIFTVELPCWKNTESATESDVTSDVLRILLCEDNLDTAVALREQLRAVGFATDFAFTAGEAITRAVATEYRAIVVDLMLPDRNGLSVVLQLRQLPQYCDTPVIVVSSDPNRGRDDIRSSKLNVADWLQKPVDFERLVRGLPKPAPRQAN
jgi:nitrogen-specific signal transduction histidine kinase/ActR/RegA family two-component response regulator